MIMTSPPILVSPAPTVIAILPPLPFVDVPDPIDTLPEPPFFDVPELNTNEPLMPFVPASTARMMIDPLEVAVPDPERTVIVPPV